MLRAVEFAHQLLRECLRPGDMAVDATAGNGNDTLLLTELTAPGGMVFAFDVQREAIDATCRLLQRHEVPEECWQLIRSGHETMPHAIPPHWHGKAGAVVFNLGYLPGGDKSITTTPDATLSALRAALELLRPGGTVVAVLYTGHPGGMEEAECVRAFAAALPGALWHAVEYRTLNARNPPPSVVAIRRKEPAAAPLN